jgi:hypothetical protein
MARRPVAAGALLYISYTSALEAPAGGRGAVGVVSARCCSTTAVHPLQLLSDDCGGRSHHSRPSAQGQCDLPMPQRSSTVNH